MKKILLFIVSLLISVSMFSQLSITSTGTDYTIDFDNTVAGVNSGQYAGNGFDANFPTEGDLDGNAWRTTGFSNNQDFGDSAATGDMDQGQDDGGVGSGGLYSFEVGGSSDVAFGIQPSGSDFTPGTITLKITNNTGSTIAAMDFSYEVWSYNDQDRANSLNSSYSVDDSSYTDLSSLDFTSDEAADGSPSWTSESKSTSITGLSVADGDDIYIKWSGDNASGSGSVDEFAIDDIVINLNNDFTTVQNGDWDLPATWDQGSVPTASDNAIIAYSNDVDETTSINSLTIQSGARLDVEAALTVATNSSLGSGGKLYIQEGANYTQSSGDFDNDAGTIKVYGGTDMYFEDSSTTLTNSGTIEIFSDNELYGSLILSGTYSESGAGVLKYRRYIAGTDTWDLVGAPLSGESIEDFAGDNYDIAQEGGANEDQYAIGVYTNTAAANAAGESWLNYTEDTVGDAGDFVSGQGYQMATSGGDETTFTGDMETSDVDIDIVNNEGGTVDDATDGTKWNLVANPYPCYISVDDFISENTAVLHESHNTVWGWNGTSYDQYNSASGGEIAPGQGFMVAAIGPETTTSTLTFTTDMHTTNGSDDFIIGDVMDSDDRAELFLGINQDDLSHRTRFYFLENSTDGLDIGYDGASFEMVNNMIFSRLVDQDQGVDFDIQALSYNEMWDKVIPIGINAMAGEEITVSVTHKTTPADLNRLLRLNKKFF